ncbi:MAG: ROK family protein [Candidatus Kerfeldbacteria bacterium]|nr:ROK family protein [Candidatus Kerfeldbacteria bacterium]
MNTIYFDIGGTYIRAEVVKNGRVLFYKKISTPKKLTSFVKQLRQLVAGLLSQYQCRKIDFGVAGVVKGLVVKYCPNIKYLCNFDFKKVVPPQVKVGVDNDARAWLSRALEMNSRLRKGVVLGLTVGTGIGRTVARNGKVLPIKKFEYPEKWEQEYQQRRFESSKKLAPWLIKNLQPIISKYKPKSIVWSGGVIEKKLGFYQELVKSLGNVNSKIRVVKGF